MQSMQETNPIAMQARRQDRVTGGHKQIWGAQKVHCFEFEREDHKTKAFIPNFHEIWGED